MLFEKRLEIEKALSYSSRTLSSFHFNHIFSWQQYFQFEFRRIDDCLCIFAKNPTGVFQYLPPLGKEVRENTFRECFRYMDAINGENGVSRIENVSSYDLSFLNDVEYKKELKGYEYCYFKDDLAALEGNDFKSKRNAVNHFQKHHSFDYIPFEKNLTKQCLDLFDHWCRLRKAKYSEDALYHHMIDENRSVHQLLMDNYQTLDLVGRVIRVDGRLKAYTFGYRLNERVFCVLLEITDLNIKGLGAAVFHQFALDPALEDFKFINAMDDSFLENLSSAKMSFRPSVLLDCYTVYRNRGEK